MKEFLVATAALVGLSSAALAAEPAALTDSQLDNVVAGVTIATLLLPVALGQNGIILGGAPPIAVVGPSAFATNMVLQTISVP